MHVEFNIDDLWYIHVYCPTCATELEHEELTVTTTSANRLKAITDEHNAEVHPS